LRVQGAAAVEPEVAATAYFVVAECLANVARHAQASGVQVRLELDDPVRVVVTDDGTGGADPTSGSGLKGLLDRVEAQGGTLEVESSSGTTVTATLPNAAP
jgi:signal transduction histidine kinase